MWCAYLKRWCIVVYTLTGCTGSDHSDFLYLSSLAGYQPSCHIYSSDGGRHLQHNTVLPCTKAKVLHAL